VNWKERKLVAQELKSIYRAATLEQAERELASFAERWDKRYPSISARGCSQPGPSSFPSLQRKLLRLAQASIHLREHSIH
jgi:hypothetical protein